MIISFPNILFIDTSKAKNIIRQVGARYSYVEGELTPFVDRNKKGYIFQDNKNNEEVLIIPRVKQSPQEYARVIQANVDPAMGVSDLSAGSWLKHPLLNGRPTVADHKTEIQQVLESWTNSFSYVAEDFTRNVIGLRNPQIGAVHAVHAHWSVSNAPATIVMPTGTGKTETMLSILVSAKCSRLLVVVPTDVLRSQIAEKFLTLGMLKASGCAILSPIAKYPIVCILQHIPRTIEEVDDIFENSQIIVTTSSIAGRCDRGIQKRMAYHCPYLFIDEAHHVEAPTLSDFKDIFHGKKILQFTATPFREDGRPLDGDIIFKYPLKKAQQEGYFKAIKFRSVVEFNLKRSDKAIADKAVEQLRQDIADGKNHILMARVSNVKRAIEVFDLYSKYPEFNPVQLHTGIKAKSERDHIRRQIISGKVRIVVCVDMLGEGFDLPELKIAAFHDIRKTLAVTLQLAGRFTRVRPDLGDATFVANTADIDVQDELRKLYTQDPDWNAILPQLSDKMIGEQLSLQEFLQEFTGFAEDIPLKTMRPATSTVVYKTTCDNWTPENFRAGIPAVHTCEQIHETINHKKHTMVIVTARKAPLKWTDVETLFSWEWELYIVIWSPEQKLLFINSSTNSGEYKALAQAITGEDAMIIKGQEVFRAFAGVNRLRLQNVGLTEQIGRNVRYTGRMGSDVESALPKGQRRRTLKSVLSGNGYEDGTKATVGASRKGRIWSHQRVRIDNLVSWCKKIGAKLIDDNIDPDEVLKGTLQTEIVLERPALMPISVDWPEEMYKTLEQSWSVLIGEHAYCLNELSLEVVSPSVIGKLRFAITSENDRIEIELELFENNHIRNYRFNLCDNRQCQIRKGGTPENAADFFYNNPPVVWFFDGSFLEGNQYVKLKNISPPYDAAKIRAWDWTGVDIRKESQGKSKKRDSVQAKVIRELITQDYHMIVDDDGKGEAADIVAIRLVGNTAAPQEINVDFYHCKYSQAATPGQRINDLYEVCGQAQKSISWMSSPEKRTDLFTHLLRRERIRQDNGESSRCEIGDAEFLQTIREMTRLCPMYLKIFIVQPGVSKSNMTRDQLELLSVTENHLMETFQIDFGVIASA